MPASATLSAQIAAFCGVLRDDYGFRLGVSEARDALRALEVGGSIDVARFRRALRTVLCGARRELDAFDRAFDDFFLLRRRIAVAETVEQHWLTSVRRDDVPLAEPQWQALVAKYSASPAHGERPVLDFEASAAYAKIVDDMIASLRFGRSRRWKPQRSGERFDLRRTLRASLHTGGEPVYLRRLGHPLRNPRFVVLIDGSRSMSQDAAGALSFGHALLRRTIRSRAFTFSTGLREITRDLRRGIVAEMGDAWGGGTRLGAALRGFLNEHGALLDDDTVVLVFSDGLDFGDAKILAAAAAELRRRSAALVWLTPNASAPGYRPATQGMSAVRPSLTALLDSNTPSALSRLGSRL